jgi:hypothetical protein
MYIPYNRTIGCTPEYFNDILILNRDRHSRTTRNANFSFLPPKINRQTEGGRLFAVSTVKCWNKLPLKIRKSTSVKCFKKQLLKVILDNQKKV